MLAPYAFGTTLDAVVARQNVERLVIRPATGDEPALMERDDRLLFRYLLSFDGRAAGSRSRFLYEAYTALPELEIGNVSTAGRKVHGRLGDVDIIACGPGGRDLTDDELAILRVACLADNVVPEATGAAVLRATRLEYSVEQVVDIPQGPAPGVVEAEIATRIRAVTDAFTLVGAKVVRDFIAGSARGDSVVDATTLAPAADIAADPYRVPVCTGVTVSARVVS